jgi:hypothetical protein
MQSSLRICYPQIPLIAESISVTSGGNIALAKNLFYGGANLYYQRSSAGQQTRIDVDLGNGNEQSINFVAIRRANLLTALDEGNARIRIRGSNDSFSTQDTVFDFDNLSTGDLIKDSDLFSFLTTDSTAYRYWRIQLSTTASVVHRLGKVYFGKIFDFDRPPSYPYSYELFNSQNPFVSDSGATFKTQLRQRKREFSFSWRAVSDAKRNEFDHKVGRFLDTFQVALHHDTADTVNSPLGGSELVWGYADYGNSAGPVGDFNNVNLTVVEDIA